MSEHITVSPLGKTWLLDLDGTLVKHNGYKIDGEDTLLSGAKKLLAQCGKEDKVILLTSRQKEYADQTEAFLQRQGIRYDVILYEMPYGERILVNDRKPSGLPMAIAVNTMRDAGPDVDFKIDESL